MVQSTGYYLQYVIQVGFDCEAFQQLNFEFGRNTNTYWGSEGAASLQGKLSAVGLTIGVGSSDCGDIGQIAKAFHLAGNSSQAAAVALNAGVDQDLCVST